MYRSMAIVASLFVLAGCASQGVKAPPPKSYQPAAINDPAPLKELEAAADRATRSLRLLASARSAEARKGITPDAHERMVRAETATPPGWERPTWVQYTGAANVLLKRLAESAGYRFFEAGRRPVVMPLVEVDGHGKTLIEVMRDAVAQMPETVRVNIYPQTRSVVVTYERGPRA